MRVSVPPFISLSALEIPDTLFLGEACFYSFPFRSEVRFRAACVIVN